MKSYPIEEKMLEEAMRELINGGEWLTAHDMLGLYQIDSENPEIWLREMRIFAIE